jgi:hypothetical protein
MKMASPWLHLSVLDTRETFFIRNPPAKEFNNIYNSTL